MKITPIESGVIFRLDEHDWKYTKPGCRGLIEELKERVPSKERDYSELNQEWTIRGEFAAIVEELREKHLVDKNQGSLF